jgi:hypothetical protein
VTLKALSRQAWYCGYARLHEVKSKIRTKDKQNMRKILMRDTESILPPPFPVCRRRALFRTAGRGLWRGILSPFSQGVFSVYESFFKIMPKTIAISRRLCYNGEEEKSLPEPVSDAC